MTLNIAVIHNPIAGRRRSKRLKELLSELTSRGHQVLARSTEQAGDAREFARLIHGVDVIVAAGGDGTVNEVVDGLCARPADAAIPSVAFLPLGTANVLAWELNLPRRPEALAQMIETGATARIQPGIANGRRFILMASAGLDARAVAAVKTATKRIFGAATYLGAAVSAMLKPSHPFHVTVNGEAHDARTVIVTRARRYGGPFVLATRANLTDPDLYVVLLQSHGWLHAFRYGFGLLTGGLENMPDVKVFRAADVTVDGPDSDPVQMDGDLISVLPLRAAVDPRAIPFLVPALRG